MVIGFRSRSLLQIPPSPTLPSFNATFSFTVTFPSVTMALEAQDALDSDLFADILQGTLSAATMNSVEAIETEMQGTELSNKVCVPGGDVHDDHDDSCNLQSSGAGDCGKETGLDCFHCNATQSSTWSVNEGKIRLSLSTSPVLQISASIALPDLVCPSTLQGSSFASALETGSTGLLFTTSLSLFTTPIAIGNIQLISDGSSGVDTDVVQLSVSTVFVDPLTQQVIFQIFMTSFIQIQAITFEVRDRKCGSVAAALLTTGSSHDFCSQETIYV